MNFKIIDINDAKVKLESGNTVFIDIRDEASYTTSHLPGAKMINDSNLQEYLSTADKAQEHIIYCYHGNSSKSAASFFVESGFEDVASMAGGFGEWSSRGEKTES